MDTGPPTADDVSDPPWRLRLVADGDQRAAAIACESQVFREWYGNSPELLEAEYGPYADQTVFLVVLDSGGEAVASSRLIRPGPLGLKTLNDVTAHPWRVDAKDAVLQARIALASCWDVATLGVRRGLRAQGIYASAALYHGLIRATRANEVRSIVSVLDDRVRGLLDAVCLNLDTIPGAWAAPYLGSTSSTPVYGHCAAMVDRQRRTNPEAHRLISLGVGLDGIDLPPLHHYVLGADVDLRGRDADLRGPRTPAGAETDPGTVVA
jgi:hypothetical protein